MALLFLSETEGKLGDEYAETAKETPAKRHALLVAAGHQMGKAMGLMQAAQLLDVCLVRHGASRAFTPRGR
jgi:hypothetical protein